MGEYCKPENQVGGWVGLGRSHLSPPSCDPLRCLAAYVAYYACTHCSTGPRGAGMSTRVWGPGKCGWTLFPTPPGITSNSSV